VAICEKKKKRREWPALLISEIGFHEKPFAYLDLLTLVWLIEYLL